MNTSILSKGNKEFFMVILKNSGNGIKKEIEFYVSENGKMLINSDKPVTLPIDSILNSKDYKVMECIKSYDYSLSDQDLKNAFDKVREIIHEEKNVVEYFPSSMTVDDMLDELIDKIIEKTTKKGNENDKSSEKAEDDEKYKVDENYIMILANQMQNELDEIDCGYSKTVFCKKVRILEQIYGAKILISNRSGGKGYGYNDTGNKRYYKFNRNWREEKCKE